MGHSIVWCQKWVKSARELPQSPYTTYTDIYIRYSNGFYIVNV